MQTEKLLFDTHLRNLSLSTGNKIQLVQCIKHRLNKAQQNKSEKMANYLIEFINPHVFNLSFEHAVVRNCLNASNAMCIDGIGIKLAILLARGKWVPRVVAEHLFAELLVSLDSPVKAVLIGGQSTEPDIAATNMMKLNHNLEIVAVLDGFQDQSSTRAFIQQHSQIPLVLIGAGTPKSEMIALIATNCCESAVIFHIGGGTLNTYSGTKHRGPIWVSKIGFEWLHRFIFEPATRSRYTTGGLVFLKNLTLAPSLREEHQDNSL